MQPLILSLQSIAFSLCISSTVLMELDSCTSARIDRIFKWRTSGWGNKALNTSSFKILLNLEVVRKDKSCLYCIVFIFEKKPPPYRTIFHQHKYRYQNSLETWAVFDDNSLLPLLFLHSLTSRSQRKVVNYIPLPKRDLEKKKCTLALL